MTIKFMQITLLAINIRISWLFLDPFWERLIIKTNTFREMRIIYESCLWKSSFVSFLSLGNYRHTSFRFSNINMSKIGPWRLGGEERMGGWKKTISWHPTYPTLPDTTGPKNWVVRNPAWTRLDSSSLINKQVGPFGPYTGSINFLNSCPIYWLIHKARDAGTSRLIEAQGSADEFIRQNTYCCCLYFIPRSREIQIWVPRPFTLEL